MPQDHARRPASVTGTPPAGGTAARTAQTPIASTVPEPHGKPGGPGLFHHKGWQAPPYIQHVAGALMKQGRSESDAYHAAVGIVENWAAGHDGKGHKVHPDVQAAAIKNIAEWKALIAATHATRGDTTVSAEIARVGPEGYIHGYIFVGVPGSAAHVAALHDLASKAQAGGHGDAARLLHAAAEAVQHRNRTTAVAALGQALSKSAGDDNLQAGIRAHFAKVQQMAARTQPGGNMTTLTRLAQRAAAADPGSDDHVAAMHALADKADSGGNQDAAKHLHAAADAVGGGDRAVALRHLGQALRAAKGNQDLQSAIGAHTAKVQQLSRATTAAGRTTMTDLSRAEMSAAAINNLPDDAFAHIEPGGKKDSTGRTTPRDLRHYPIHDAPHIRNALGRAGAALQGDDPDAKRIAAAAMPKIKAAAKAKGIGQPAAAGNGDGDGAAAPATRAGDIYRTYPLEDCRIMRASDGSDYASGRVVEAYAAIWNTPAEIHDHEGHYEEEIDPAAFNDALRAAHPSLNNGYWRVAYLFNHGMTVHGTPAERFSLPAGVPQHISAEAHGLLTRTYMAETPLGDELLELVSIGALRSQSFTGGIVRSTPPLRGPGDRYRKQPGGGLTRVRRLTLGLREYGLTPFAAYSGAEVLGVRMQLPAGYQTPAAEEYDPVDADALAGMDGDGSGDPPGAGDASRSLGNRLYRLRTQEMLEQAGITLPAS